MPGHLVGGGAGGVRQHGHHGTAVGPGHRPDRARPGRARSPITALCEIPLERRTLLASASWDGTVRLWNPATGRPERVLGVRGEYGMCPLEIGDRTLLATDGDDQTVRLSDPATDSEPEVVAEDVAADAMCPVRGARPARHRRGHRPVPPRGAAVGPHRTAAPRSWCIKGEMIGALCEVDFGGRTRLAVGPPTVTPPSTRRATAPCT